MDDPEWQKFAGERSPRIPEPIRAPRKSRKGLAVMLLGVAGLYAMCRVPNWDGTGSAGLSAQQQREALESPLPSEGKRQAASVAAYRSAAESIRLLCEVAAEESPAGEHARLLLEHLRDQLGR